VPASPLVRPARQNRHASQADRTENLRAVFRAQPVFNQSSDGCAYICRICPLEFFLLFTVIHDISKKIKQSAYYNRIFARWHLRSVHTYPFSFENGTYSLRIRVKKLIQDRGRPLPVLCLLYLVLFLT